jgi:uncharacterized protein YyaL (SSP411 family)
MATKPYLRIATDVLRNSRDLGPLMLRDFRNLAALVVDSKRRAFVRHVVVDYARYGFGRVKPIEGETRERLAAAARWLVKAHEATGRNGLSYGYFPCKSASGWRVSYPETSGYTIPTLIAVSRALGDEEYRARAIEIARWELTHQMPSGAMPGGSTDRQKPIGVAFNTGMVLQGLVAAWSETRDHAFLEAARRATEYLAGDIDADGHFCSHGPFVGPSVIKTYTCLCAWPMYLAGQELGERRYLDAAVGVGRAALRQQNAAGWFDRNCLRVKGHAPLTHTIGYTLQGLLELGIVAGEEPFILAVRKALDGLLPACERGFLANRWYADWRPAGLSSCLTGAAQIAAVCLRLAEHTGDERCRRGGDALLNYLKALQSLHSKDLNVVGAIGGSFPLTGAYARFGFPEWATKYFADALILQDSLHTRDMQSAARLESGQLERARNVQPA